MEWSKLDEKEILRYLGMPRWDTETHDAARRMEAALKSAASPRYTYAFSPLDRETMCLSRWNVPLRGKSVAEHLQGCTHCGVLAATLGEGMDALLRKTQILSMGDALVLDAVATAAVEQVCDIAQREMEEAWSGGFSTWRFSPGYGDLPIEIQPLLLNGLQAGKRIGLSCTESYLLTPTKSVTAIVGFGEGAVRKKAEGCSACNLAGTCNYRKRGVTCGA